MEIKDYIVTRTLTVYDTKDMGNAYAELKYGKVFIIEAFNYDNIRISFLKDGKLAEGFISYNQLKYAAREFGDKEDRKEGGNMPNIDRVIAVCQTLLRFKLAGMINEMDDIIITSMFYRMDLDSLTSDDWEYVIEQLVAEYLMLGGMLKISKKGVVSFK